MIHMDKINYNVGPQYEISIWEAVGLSMESMNQNLSKPVDWHVLQITLMPPSFIVEDNPGNRANIDEMLNQSFNNNKLPKNWSMN